MPIIQANKELPDRVPLDFYPTPLPLVARMVEESKAYIWKPTFILDPSSGEGIFGEELRSQYGADPIIIGAELDPGRAITSRASLWYDLVVTGNFLKYSPLTKFDLIIGNPPYYVCEEFVQHGLTLLSGRGTMMYLLRTAFLESQTRYHRIFKQEATRPTEVWSLVERPSFTGNNKTGSDAYSIFIWHMLDRGKTTELKWLSWR